MGSWYILATSADTMNKLTVFSPRRLEVYQAQTAAGVLDDETFYLQRWCKKR
jgi:hypothetical protein